MASADSTEPLIWRPRLPAHRRLAADPRDFRRFHCGQRVGVFLGHGWSGAVVQQVGPEGVLVRTKRTGEQRRSALRVRDARNLVPQQELRSGSAGAGEQGTVL
ncbi:MAG: hypothetical protein VKN15_02120 [Cyanobacteriota bacterium]|nr:hypothetical protein [Cyanobacteriota bacterium]